MCSPWIMDPTRSNGMFPVDGPTREKHETIDAIRRGVRNGTISVPSVVSNWVSRESGRQAMSAILTQAIVSHFFEIQDNTNLYLLIEHVDDLRAAKGVSPASWPLPPLPLLPQLHHATWCDDLSLIQLFTVFDILKEALRRLLVLEGQIRAHRDLHLFVNGEVSDATQMRDNGDGQAAAVKRPRSKCALCDATRSDSGGSLHWCRGCQALGPYEPRRGVRYCSKECQKRHWRIQHKDVCLLRHLD